MSAVCLPPYESEAVREMFERAYSSSYGLHQITRVLESPCGMLKSYRCQQPNRWTYGFDVIVNGATLVVTGDIGECMWKREMGMLNWFAKSFPDLHYLAGKVPHAIKTREFCDAIAEGAYRRRLEQLEGSMSTTTFQLTTSTRITRRCITNLTTTIPRSRSTTRPSSFSARLRLSG